MAPTDLNLVDPRAYRRLAALIRQQIGDGTLQPGRPAPSITSLSQEYGHARQTCSRRGSSGFHVADELVFQSVPGSVRGSPNRGITLAPKPLTAVMRSPAIVTTSSP
jgi:DNA-binding transcriptional MocR family regulator